MTTLHCRLETVMESRIAFLHCINCWLCKVYLESKVGKDSLITSFLVFGYFVIFSNCVSFCLSIDPYLSIHEMYVYHRLTPKTYTLTGCFLHEVSVSWYVSNRILYKYVHQVDTCCTVTSFDNWVSSRLKTELDRIAYFGVSGSRVKLVCSARCYVYCKSISQNRANNKCKEEESDEWAVHCLEKVCREWRVVRWVAR